jgi:hypothetical protein
MNMPFLLNRKIHSLLRLVLLIAKQFDSNMKTRLYGEANAATNYAIRDFMRLENIPSHIAIY